MRMSPHRDNPFLSFWMGGYEGADHVNGVGEPLDMVAASGHAAQIEADHRRAAALGIRSVRESIGWRLAEPEPGRYDLERTLAIARSAERHGLQVIWTLMHYGTPLDVSMLDDAMCERFARFAGAVAEALRGVGDMAPVYNPINEIGFLGWAAAETNLIHPYRGDPRNVGPRTDSSGYDIKRRLVRASLEGMAAMRRADPRARFIHIEPLVHAVAPRSRPDLLDLAEQIASYQWQVWDMLIGRTEPQLGGHEEALDCIGVNYYHSGQWEVMTEERLDWWGRDPRRLPLSALLKTTWDRYRRPMIVAETSHFGEGRAAWLHEVADEVRSARGAGVPVYGICLYPLVDRPDWTETERWHDSGLWDVDHEMPGFRRVEDRPCVAALREWQRLLPSVTVSQGAAALAESASSSPLFATDRAIGTIATIGTMAGAAAAASAAPLLRTAVAGGSNPSGAAAYRPATDDTRRQQPPTSADAKPWLVAFSPLRWRFVRHRPQQLMDRLRVHYRVLFIEEPLPADDGAAPWLDRICEAADLDVLVPRTPLPANGFDDAQLPLLLPMIGAHLRACGAADAIAWMWTPMALPLLATMQPRAVVYDCFAEMAAFGGAPQQMADREHALLRRADLVFAAGPALLEAKRAMRSDVRQLPNGVDAAAFAPGSVDRGAADARVARRLQPPSAATRLGYFGVIDERFDTEIAAALADAHPEWELVFVGPVAKIDPAALPQRPNIRWAGYQAHTRLAHFAAGWSVCLMPYARNAATRTISPLKTLEYLATEKPVVTTPIADVLALHGRLVRVATDAAGFIRACEEALAESVAERGRRVAAARAAVAASGWDGIAASVHVLLQEVASAPASESQMRQLAGG
jgi:UDP-galactopyranose mutase